MDAYHARRLARIEWKINILAKAMSFVLAVAIGFAVYFLSENRDWAPWFGLGAGILAGGIFELRMANTEKVIPPHKDDDSD